MAKTTDRDLFDKLRARGLRKNAASNLARAFGRADNSPPSKGAKRAVSELRDLVSELESRVGGGDSKRRAAAKKAAATRAKSSSSRSTSRSSGSRSRSRAKS